MTSLEQTLLAEELSYVQVYCDEKLEGLVEVEASLQRDGVAIVSAKGMSIKAAIDNLDAKLGGRLIASAARSFWEEWNIEHPRVGNTAPQDPEKVIDPALVYAGEIAKSIPERVKVIKGLDKKAKKTLRQQRWREKRKKAGEKLYPVKE